MKLIIAILLLPVHFIIDMYGRIQEYFRLKCEDCGGNLVFMQYYEDRNVAEYGCVECGRKHLV